MIVVTGGAGFIGSNLVAGLEARGVNELVVCDRLGQGDKWRNVAKREIADLVPPDRLLDYLDIHAREIECVFHMGAVSATTERDVDLIMRENFTLSLALWHWCARHGVRLIYASSAATFGDGAQGFDDDGSIGALERLRPLNAYGWSKHVYDRRVARLVDQGDVVPPQWAGLKFFNVYGPNEYHKGTMKSVAAHIYPRAARGEPARLFKSHRPDYADGGQLRDFVWVDDCVDVMLWLYDNTHVNGLFNVGTGAARSFADLAAAVFVALGREPRIEFVDTPAEIRDKYQYFTQAEIGRLRAAGYGRQFMPLEAGVSTYVRDFLAAPDPYR
ncbi:MAG: ADP-glyceromanno-heptose 6-epimerase [Alphaproteobacteria bacterium]|nr:ADP-glyceromanno-heptose 6-epimerase [Alphaproteobacteria bacterium]